jgi:hypothetical protein
MKVGLMKSDGGDLLKGIVEAGAGIFISRKEGFPNGFF